jgi:hypothetical protein
VSLNGRTLKPLVALGDAGVLTMTALTLDEAITYEQFEALGTALGAFDRACKWWIGDLLLYGEDVFPDRYPQAAALTGLSEQTLLNRVTTCRAVPPARRNPRVSYSCHAEVAPLKAREQTKWLTYAERNQSTVAQLRAAMKETREEQPALPTTVEPDPEVLATAVRALVASAEVAGENVICRLDDYKRVLSALGEEE